MITFVNIIYQSQKLRRSNQRISFLLKRKSLKMSEIFKNLLDFITLLW